MEPKQLLYRAVDSMEASMLVQALEEQGVPATATGGFAAVGFGELPADARMVDIFVARENLERGRQILVEHQAKALEESKSEKEWVCPFCRELNAATFEICWSCQQTRP